MMWIYLHLIIVICFANQINGNTNNEWMSLRTLIANDNNSEQLKLINKQRLKRLNDIEEKYMKATQRSRNYEREMAKRDKQQLEINKEIHERANAFNLKWMKSNIKGTWNRKRISERNNFKEQTEKIIPSEYLLKASPIDKNPVYLKMIQKNKIREKAHKEFMKKNGKTWSETESLLNQINGVVGKVNELEKQRKLRKKYSKPKYVKIVYKNNGPQYYRKRYIHKPITPYINTYYNKPFTHKIYKKVIKSIHHKPVKYEFNKDKKFNAFLHDDTWKNQMQLKWKEYEQKRLSSKEHEQITRDIKKMELEEKNALNEIKTRMTQSEKELQKRSELLKKALQHEREMSEKKIAKEIQKKAIEFAIERNKLRRQFKETMNSAFKKLQVEYTTNGSEKVDNSNEMKELKILTKKVLKNLNTDETPVSILI
ncbi:hypothetical protein ENUP19_0009G0010 [Entamoeba nuttalli]|uniref:Uncharacterized protein n=2 Tax=Entamoeba nuttalli TaxID=412467 RepID=K2GGF5_ENTNP|nr:hypothetical protein ENU1_043130 [Entamoeba nuttalli P19]EKE41836.1 hypothetical protein ENU1_043130 [Entamoeba nuttalli P19]|eukprot:XP_008855829.1 hypothetical protein ENU1_043130 [Entamoeba nuttalli P19]